MDSWLRSFDRKLELTTWYMVFIWCTNECFQRGGGGVCAKRWVFVQFTLHVIDARCGLCKQAWQIQHHRKFNAVFPHLIGILVERPKGLFKCCQFSGVFPTRLTSIGSSISRPLCCCVCNCSCAITRLARMLDKASETQEKPWQCLV